MLGKLSYFARGAALLPFTSARRCPNCGSPPSQELDRKFFVTRLVRCDSCLLMYRTPTDSVAFSHRFYNLHYVQGTAMICPTEAEIAQLKETNFAGTERDFACYIAFLERHGVRPPARLLDFGCSWGYGSYQFARAGYDTYSFEIAVDRRNYGIAKLGVRHINDVFDIAAKHPLFESFDCFFSAHVLEHVPSPSKVIELAWRCLKAGGLFVAFTPNGCDAFRSSSPRAWRNMWGEVHPNYLDDLFYDKQFARSRRVYESRDGGDVMKQYELGFVAWKDAAKGGF